jgi:polyhydroxyalkanoate synthesis repressor PhaR
MIAVPKPGPLHVRKYSNRRYYDTTRSCNVTLADLHAAIADGYDIAVTDASTSEDITNAVLVAMILEYHAPKLAIFPAPILHQIIRTQQQFLGGVVEQFFRQAVEAQRATQAQWGEFIQRTFGFRAPSPADWLNPFAARPQSSPPMPDATPPPAENAPRENDLTSLREQLAELSRRIEQLSKKQPADD